MMAKKLIGGNRGLKRSGRGLRQPGEPAHKMNAVIRHMRKRDESMVAGSGQRRLVCGQDARRDGVVPP